MSRRITKVTDLPSWFDTSKYNDAIRLDARGWHEQLTVRQICHFMLSASEGAVDLEESETYGFQPIEFLSAVRACPIFMYNGSRFAKSIEENLGFSDTPAQHQHAYPPGIFGITASDIGEIILDWEPKQQKEFLDWLEFKRAQRSSPKDHGLPRPRVPWLFRPLRNRYITPIRVAAVFPDQVLRQSFELFVSKEREKIDSKFLRKAKRSNTFLEWCNCGLLQYLDLSIWSIEKDRSITNKVLANGIFPNSQEKGEENIRTTTKKHASAVLGESTMSGLSMSVLSAYARLEDFLESQ